jgi:hypothetical protein
MQLSPGPGARALATALLASLGVATGAAQTAPDAARANSYDDAWQSAWVAHCRGIFSEDGKTAGFVLQIGDSITYSRAYALWPVQGMGQTAADQAVIGWAHAASWGQGEQDTGNKNGFYLATANTVSPFRGMTAAGSIDHGEYLTGDGNDPAAARQAVASTAYTQNLQIDTVIAAFGDAQFAVLMLGTNDLSLGNFDAYASIVTKLEDARIVPVLSTVPPRAGADQAVADFNAAIRDLAETRSLPLIDFHAEIMLRRPGSSWQGTLIGADGIHPTANNAEYTVTGDPYLPGGDPATHRTGDALLNSGYLLRSWLTVQKLKEIKAEIVEGVAVAPAAPTSLHAD